MKIKKETIPYWIGGFAFICSLVGYMLLENANFFRAFYKTFGLFGGNAELDGINCWISLASFLAPIAVTSAIAFLFLEKIKERWFFWQEAHEHCVVIGLGNMGLTLINNILEHNDDIASKLVVIEIDNNNPHIEELKSKGVIVLIGDASSPSILQKVKIDKASKVICLTGNDLSNVEVAIQTVKLSHERKPALYLHLAQRENNELLKASVFKGVNVKSFSVYDNAAQTLFMQFPIGHNVNTLDKEDIVMLAIVGFDAVGESLVYRALNLGHFYNECPLRITIFDKDHLQKQKEFEKRYPVVEEFNGKYWDVSFKDEAELYTSKALPYTQIIFCAKESENTYADAMHLIRHKVKQIHENKCEVYFFSDIYDEIASLIDKENSMDFKHLHSFGAIKHMCSYDAIVNEHLDTMAYNSHEGYKTLHDDKTPWEKLDAFIKDSNRMQVEHLQIKLPIITHYLEKATIEDTYENLKEKAKEKWFIHGGEMKWDNIEGAKELLMRIPLDVIETLARIEHRRWNAFHILNGWSVLSPLGKERKDKELKLHACLVEWEKLSDVSLHLNKYVKKEDDKHDYKSDDIETVLRAQHMTAFLRPTMMKKCYMKQLIENFRDSLSKDCEK